MTDTDRIRKPRRMAREQQAHAPRPAASPSPKTTKLAQVEALLLREGGASIAEMVATTGWQQHSVRGAMAGALKKRGLIIASDKVDGLRRYRAAKPT